jgi:hypothetical protein
MFPKGKIMLNTLLTYLIILGIAALVGLIIALPVLLPPLRRRGRQRDSARKTEILVCGLVAFVLTFGGWNYAKAMYAVLWIGLGGGYTSDLTDNDAFPREIWLRESIPPFTQQVCFTQDAQGCRVADYYVEHSGYTPAWAWFNYALTLVYSLAAGGYSGLLVRRFTRPVPTGVS